MPFVTSSFLFLVVRPGTLVASLLLAAMPFVGAPQVVSLLLVAMLFVTTSFLFLVVRPEVPLVASLLLVAIPFVTN